MADNDARKGAINCWLCSGKLMIFNGNFLEKISEELENSKSVIIVLESVGLMWACCDMLSKINHIINSVAEYVTINVLKLKIFMATKRDLQ